mmetsp:Transcript_17877/g.25144  ORF Transcript_17877/g.25144 Transcript_17877/m.25144 type:complete len:205 (+) Transcript_17877:273-887(+)
MLFLGGDNTNTAFVGTTSDHSDVTDVKFDAANNFAGSNVEFDGVVGLNDRVGVADSAAIVGGDVWDDSSLALDVGVGASHSLRGVAEVPNAAELELGFLGVLDAVEDKAALVVIEDAEFLFGLGDRDDIHKTAGIVEISANLAVNFHQFSHDNSLSFLAGESVLEAVLQNETHREAVPHFVRTSGRTRSPVATELVKHPVLGGI